MDYIQLIKILIEWSVNSKEYDMLLFLYKNFNIGIPIKFVYKLPDNNIFYSLSSFTNNNDIKSIADHNLNELFLLFKKSKYKQLCNWNNNYGYINM